MSLWIRGALAGALVGLLWNPFSGEVLATSVRSVSVSEMLAASELVFEGRVVSRRVVERGQTKKEPWTCALFDVLDVIQGTPPATRFELCFLGGRIGDSGLLIGEMRYPAVGEHGIYFVERPGRNQVNPLFGWSQGHFRVVDGVTCTADGRPVQAVRSRARVRPDLSDGTAEGLDVGPEAGTHGLSPTEFKQRLGELREEAAR